METVLAANTAEARLYLAKVVACSCDQFMPDHSNERAWTREEVRREEQAERARVRRDGARGVSENLKDAVAHTEFAKRFADAFKRTRRV